MLRFHILSNNHASKEELLTEHGLSVLVETDEKKILFDTGESDIFLHNSKKMGHDINSVDYIVLSHGHYDHTTGLKCFNFDDSSANLCIHPGALKEKYKVINDEEKYIGIPWGLDDINIKEERIVFNPKLKHLTENIMAISEIPRITDFEEIPKHFKIKEKDELKDDTFLDEQMLVVKTEKGIVILLGCSHPGVINCIKHAMQLTDESRVRAVIGGMHLKEASTSQLHKTIESLKDMGIDKVFPMHCTGTESMIEMKKILKDICILCNAGDTIEI
ncbi:MBL fold metallo-hydrolase [Wukongibacter baidiensis]|uniref:MBL fold metallo-hydrolase n=1 Tax=Wukongibacter baidiensis TaxID=1723361 RepID=UPI003D7FA1BC